MSKIYKNDLFKKKTVQKSRNPYFWKNPYLYGQIRTSGNTDKDPATVLQSKEVPFNPYFYVPKYRSFDPLPASDIF